MKKTFAILLSALFALTLTACITAPSALIDDDRIHVTILHFNAIYEITPVSGGTEGGIARVATLRKQLLARNSNYR